MLKAAWLGDWKAPWGLDRGRRWGDPPWALAAIAQAWLLGGREGRWPQLEQEARRPQGPRVTARPVHFEERPDPGWVARLRHGSPGADPRRRGPQEDELLAWAWEALLAGDGLPWMAAGSVVLDLPRRLRWVALLGAVGADGTLHLPPFLDLIPGEWLRLPAGWWETLLRAQDPEGRLLPEGTLDPERPWPDIQAHSGPLVLDSLPEALRGHAWAPWLFQSGSGAWMLAPGLRAWSRGFGASPQGLGPLVPPGLASGRPPGPDLTALLDLRMPEHPPEGWEAALEADLQERADPPGLPPPSGHLTWDRLRVRWGGGPPPPSPGYPTWDQTAHPCADPFHWMAQGKLTLEAYRPEDALRSFSWAFAHFNRLGKETWAKRAASNAAYSALQWADLPSHARWAKIRGPMPQPWQDIEFAQLAEIHRDPGSALQTVQKLVDHYPAYPVTWGQLASLAADLERWDLVRDCLPHVRHHPYARFLEAALGPLEADPPEDADPETRLSWEAHRLFRGVGRSGAFWEAWEACPTQIMRLEMGLQVLERCPDQRMAHRLLALQAIADRAQSPRHQRRLEALWPQPDPGVPPAPASLLEAWLARRIHPAWLVWEEAGRLQSLGAGEAPPDGALSSLAKRGSLPPMRQGAWVWRGHPLTWEGAPVGAVLLAQPWDGLPAPSIEPELLAPWLSALRAKAPAAADPGAGLLLTDGSEPMASVLRDLDRVAASELPVLILGPTGCGKELAASEVHHRSGRPGPLVAVNCSAFAEGLLESELFGHVKGAFTDAHRDRRGAIEVARGGTLFLDEVADLSPRLQSLLLRVLQEREIRRVGSDHALKVDVRFVAATHRPMEELSASGAFRRDLLFRLQGAVLNLPPLAARRHEFPFLLPRLVLRAAEAVKRPAPALAPGLARTLSRLPWPGNVRELLHALERAILRCEERVLRPGHFPELSAPALQARSWDEATRAFQRQLLLDTLHACQFRVAEAAEMLGLARPALYATARRLGLDLVAERQARS
ncbi:MAG: sigma-54-dependent Fis family transcriptional regulator [Acidobacteria bacterium]|nr:sigma-54-dependent Fis family transcriptional regulator [Acidobacteriota bacterium]MBI3488742.1 sigma-54-dependent Fis family transcriptional regulator [Acidobacteriota bacterium]